MKDLLFWNRDITEVEYLSSVFQFFPYPPLKFSARPSSDPIQVFSLLAFFVLHLHHLIVPDLQELNHEGSFLLGDRGLDLWHRAEMPLVLTAD